MPVANGTQSVPIGMSVNSITYVYIYIYIYIYIYLYKVFHKFNKLILYLEEALGCLYTIGLRFPYITSSHCFEYTYKHICSSRIDNPMDIQSLCIAFFRCIIVVHLECMYVYSVAHV